MRTPGLCPASQRTQRVRRLLMPTSPKRLGFQTALDRIEALGGSCVFDGTIQAVVLTGTRVTDDDLSLFNDLPTVEIMDLSDTLIGDAGLARLAHLERLQELVLVNT